MDPSVPTPSQMTSDPRSQRIARVCRVIEAAESLPDLAHLAGIAGLSRFHFLREFKAVTGVTPKAYGVAHRRSRVQAALRSRETVTEALYEAGYNSSGRFYAEAPSALGMTPQTYRRGGAHEEIRFAVGYGSLGSVLAASTPVGVCAILMGDDPEALVRDLQDRFAHATLIGDDPAYTETLGRILALTAAPETPFDLPLDIRGTAFQQRVWAVLRTIPAGATVSYSDIAERLGQPRAVRAVAGACAANALAIAIPCHRVIRQDGHLSGYRWGLERKQALLDAEQRAQQAA